MTRDQLEHAIRAACDVADDDELWVFGSQAILGSIPDAPASLRASIEVDVQPRNAVERTDEIDCMIGELSLFHATHGFYVHGVSIETAVLPAGWHDRAVPVQESVGTRGCIGWCLELHDLAVSKLAAYRDKDREFVQTLIAENLVNPSELIQRIDVLEVDDNLKRCLRDWVRRAAES